MPAAAHCPICFNDFAIDAGKPEFLIFPCGHGFCTTCTESVFNPEARKKCPICRKLIHRRDAHPVFLELVESKVALANTVVEGIAQMSANTPALSVKRASQKISQVVQAEPAPDTLTMLLQALQDFNERIIPLFSKVETQQKDLDQKSQELTRSRRERDEIHARIAHIGPLQTEVQRLRNALSETEANTQEALSLAESAKDKLQTQCQLAEQWQKQAAALEKKNSDLHEIVQRHQSYGKKKKDKCRKLETELAAAMERLNGQNSAYPVSESGLDYDGDFSGHEFAPRTQAAFRVPAPTPLKSSPRHSVQDENDFELNFEGLPNIDFPSEWKFERAGAVLKKRTSNGMIASNHRRVTNPLPNPLQLDKKGHPTRAVQLGPRNSIRLGRG
ncbi:hypothetical protein D9619_006218 [Psilocybe cf. subviscida]|uniref:RING-type domain-containing protein n=1 Tax=Psilocybe cf. subviscida TaxID=2480587 RepID=A0A8H5B4B6_9AGAR|nr:hypothetical protein D9619_006218 [Psilocybe cf. subviscida]